MTASASGTPPSRAPGLPWWLFPALLGVTLVAYQPAWQGGILWDDAAHITRPELQSLHGLWRIWFDIGATQQYYPVTYSAFWALHRIWGDSTLGYHLVNIGLHATSAFLLACLLRRFRAPGAILAALIFALHPVQVESVAWMTELKNTLSGVLYLAAAWVYLDFDARQSSRYLVAFGLFVLAVLAKTVAVTLPAALLVVFWWQRGRIRWREDVVPLVPFFVAAAGVGLLVAWVERSLAGAEGAEYQFTLIERCLIAGRAVWFYVEKLAWPANLIFIYPRWDVSQAVWWQYLYPLAALVLITGLWMVRGWSRAPLAAVLFFIGTLVPALGFFNVYAFQFSFVADHFQYLASIGIIALGAGATAWLAGTWRLQPIVRTVGAIVLCAVLAALTWQQSVQYKDVKTLYRTTIARNPACWMAYNNLGDVIAHESPENLSDAVQNFQAALRIRPDYAPAHNNLGASWQRMGRLDEALVEFREATRLAPRFLNPWVNGGNVLRQMGRREEAVQAYQEAIRLKPDDFESRTNVGGMLFELGRYPEAAGQLTEAMRLDPNSTIVRANLARVWTALGNSLSRSGRPADALAPYQEALMVSPDSGEAHNNLAGALLQLGRLEEALPHFEQAVRLMPDSAAARENLDHLRAMLNERALPR